MTVYPVKMLKDKDGTLFIPLTNTDSVQTTTGDSLETMISNKVDKETGKGLSTNDYTTTEKNKLAGIAANAEVNQNAFSNIKVGSTTVAADAKTDTLELVAGDNITLTPDATNDKITIAATDTKYTAASVAPGNVASSSSVGTSTNYARQDHTHGISLASGDASGQVKIAGTNVTVKNINNAAYKDIDTSISAASTSTKLPTSQAVAAFVEGKGYTTNTGTITKVQANGTDVASSGTANIPAASTSAYGVTKLSDATNSTSTALAATANAVKKAYDLAASKTSNTGTVTSIGLTAGSGISISGSPITTSGNITVGHSNSITAQTTSGLYPIKIDAQGHITQYGAAYEIATEAEIKTMLQEMGLDIYVAEPISPTDYIYSPQDE